MLIIYCCHGSSTQKKRRYYLGKITKCPTIKTPWRGPFVVILSFPTAGKVAKITPRLNQG
jgi:hypothetical protein